MIPFRLTRDVPGVGLRGDVVRLPIARASALDRQGAGYPANRDKDFREPESQPITAPAHDAAIRRPRFAR